MTARVALAGLALLVIASGAQAQRDAGLSAAPTLHADQPIGLVDVPLRITVSGLTPQQVVRVSATSRTSTDRALVAYAVFRADDAGGIDLSTAKPLEGTYSKLDPMGLFWSMSPQPVPVEIWSHLDLPKFHPPDPWTVLLEVVSDRGGTALATLRLVRLYAAPNLRTMDLHEAGLVGKLVLPPQGDHTDRIPAIVLLGGSEGGLDEAGATLLASHGYAALTLAYFGVEGMPPELVDIAVECPLQAVKWLQARPEIDRERIAIIGRSRGSELALLAASVSSEVKAVVAISPNSVVWGGISKSPGIRSVPAWTYDGKPLPFLSANQAPAELVQEFYAKGPLHSRLYDYLFADRDAVTQATIPVERIQGSVLLISGTDDRVWGSPIMAQQIVQRATRFNRAGSFASITYDGAGHNIREPYRPTPGQARLGGTAEDHARAEQDSWQKMLAFLQRSLMVRR
jgi:dienelactone hydrolase